MGCTVFDIFKDVLIEKYALSFDERAQPKSDGFSKK